MRESELLRKPLTKILLVNWSRFGAVEMKINKSTLFTGINGSGKSTVLDALTYIIAGNNKFNTAAKDKDRTVLSYVRGDTKSKGKAQYLRSGNVISYVAMEFYSPNDKFYITVGVCIESADDMNWNPNWFLVKDAEISDINFYHKEGNRLVVTPKNELKANVNTIMFVVLNTTSLEIIPTTILSLRTSLGSTNPESILLPGILSTFASTISGILLVKICSKIFKQRRS